MIFVGGWGICYEKLILMEGVGWKVESDFTHKTEKGLVHDFTRFRYKSIQASIYSEIE